MKSSRIGIHLLSVLLLLLWGGLMLYFYASGRLASGEYLARDGWFRPIVLVAGVGLCVLGLFNLTTIGAKDADCCDHDHKHDQAHDHGHEGCCGHHHGEHGHEHSHEHHHEHDHGTEAHAPATAAHDHAHGILEESGPVGRLVAILILAVPVSYAAMKSPDRFSAQTAVNKGVYDQNYKDTSSAKQYSRVKNEEKKPADLPQAPAATPATATPPAPAAAKSEDTPPATVAENSSKDAGSGPAAPAEAKSNGSFTLADLKSQVPQSPEGNFQLEVPELYYTAGDKEVQGVLTGQPVETIAQVLPEKLNNAEGKRLRIFRLLVQCCAADARPFSIPVEFESKAPDFKEMTWVKVIGSMTYKSENGQVIPILLAKTMTETAEPDNKMIY
ncbi:MAG TPA: hypothetical protein VGH65_06740 [Verrucomicrobiaceae bacterium]